MKPTEQIAGRAAAARVDRHDQTDPTDLTDPSDHKPSRTAIVVSCLVCPGAGQIMQKRWVAGVFFGGAFVALLLALVYEVMRPMFRNMLIAVDAATFGESEPFVQMSIPGILTYFGAALVVYLVNVVDVVLGYLRARRLWLESRQPHAGGPVAGA